MTNQYECSLLGFMLDNIFLSIIFMKSQESHSRNDRKLSIGRNIKYFFVQEFRVFSGSLPGLYRVFSGSFPGPFRVIGLEDRCRVLSECKWSQVHIPDVPTVFSTPFFLGI